MELNTLNDFIVNSTNVVINGNLENININKNLYNLGAFDIYVLNTDSMRIVGRNTEAVTVKELNIVASTHYDCYFGYIDDKRNPNHLNADITTAPVGNIPFEYQYTGVLIFGKELTGGVLLSADDFIAQFGDRIIQYKLTPKYQYEEPVIENQPIRLLPQNGEQWLREEWKKGLNYSIVKEVAQKVSTVIANDLPAGTYTFSLNDSNVNPEGEYIIYANGINISPSNPPNTPVSFTFSITEPSTISVYVNLVGGTTSIMLNEGSHPYPYEPYYGGIVRQKELEENINSAISTAITNTLNTAV